MRETKGTVSEYIIRVISFAGLLIVFFVFSLFFNLHGCMRTSSLYRTYDKYHYLLETTTEQLLETKDEYELTFPVYSENNGEEELMFNHGKNSEEKTRGESKEENTKEEGNDQNDFLDIGNELSNMDVGITSPQTETFINFAERIKEGLDSLNLNGISTEKSDRKNSLKGFGVAENENKLTKNEKSITPLKENITLSLRDAIALWAQYDKVATDCNSIYDSDFKKECWKVVSDGRSELQNQIFAHICSRLCDISRSIYWDNVYFINHPESPDSEMVSLTNEKCISLVGFPCEIEKEKAEIGSRVTNSKIRGSCEYATITQEIPLFAPMKTDSFVYFEITYYDCAPANELSEGVGE